MTRAMTENPWFAFLKPRPRARVRLFCFPFAGGGAMIYRGWSDVLPAEIEVVPIQLPGRERRMREAPFTQMAPLVDALVEALSPHLDDLPYAFFGHSMGAVIGYEVAHHLRQAGHSLPRQLLVSARTAPQLAGDSKQYYALPDPEFRARLEEINGTPQAVLENDELMTLMMPLLRADFELNDTYPETLHPPFDCPVSAYGGLSDEDVSEKDLRAWSEVTSGPFKLRMMRGDHFFLNDEPGRSALHTAVAEDLLRQG